jgi:hypothetical protein
MSWILQLLHQRWGCGMDWWPWREPFRLAGSSSPASLRFISGDLSIGDFFFVRVSFVEMTTRCVAICLVRHVCCYAQCGEGVSLHQCLGMYRAVAELARCSGSRADGAQRFRAGADDAVDDDYSSHST